LDATGTTVSAIGSPQQQPPRRPAPSSGGLDAVYNWFSSVSSSDLGGALQVYLTSCQGNGERPSSLLNGGSGGTGSTGEGTHGSTAAPSLGSLEAACRAPQAQRPDRHREGVVEPTMYGDQPAVRGKRDSSFPPDWRQTQSSSFSRRGNGGEQLRSEPGLHHGSMEGAGSAASGGSFARRNRLPGTYEVDKEDLLDQHVGYYLRHHPHVRALHVIVRKRQGVYDLDGREIKVEWQYATEPGGQGFLVVVDGPLRQPFADYMEMTEANAEYDSQGIGSRSALHNIPKEKRMSFHDQHKMYSRLEAMKVAKEQALVRERAADYIKDGREVPGDLMMKYKKTIQQKLDPGGRRANAARQRSTEALAAAAQRAGELGGHSSAATGQQQLPPPHPPTSPGPPAPRPTGHPYGSSSPQRGGSSPCGGSPNVTAAAADRETNGPSCHSGDAPSPGCGMPANDFEAPAVRANSRDRRSSGQTTPPEPLPPPQQQQQQQRHRRLPGTPEPPSRVQARTESPGRASGQWPPYGPPAEHEHLPARSYVPPVPLEPQTAGPGQDITPQPPLEMPGVSGVPGGYGGGGPPTGRNLSQEWQGPLPLPPPAAAAAAAAAVASGGGPPPQDWSGGDFPTCPPRTGSAGAAAWGAPGSARAPAAREHSGGSPLHVSKMASVASWQGPSSASSRGANAAQLLGPQPCLFGGAQGPSLGGSGPSVPVGLGPGLGNTLGSGLGSGLGTPGLGGILPTHPGQPPQQPYAWWQQ